MVLVAGIGAVVLPDPPDALVYHFRLVPVAESTPAVASLQYSTGVLTIGAVGKGLIFTLMLVLGPSQPHVAVWLT